jgi:hypothetical protein
MDDAMFRGDCGRCAGLCCVLLGFDRGPAFGFDKPAGEACRHLSTDHRCAIHDRLDASGFSGCAHYDCRGAGQIVTAMFAGLEQTPPNRRALDRAFAAARQVQLLRLTLARTPASIARSQVESRLIGALGSYADVLQLDLVAARRDVAGLVVRALTPR